MKLEMFDINGREIKLGDKVKYALKARDTTCIGVVKFGTFEQDGSSDEYGSSKILGVYIERERVIFAEGQSEDDLNYLAPDYLITISVLEVDSIEVLS